MRRRIQMLIMAAILAMTMSFAAAGTAFALSPEQECEAPPPTGQGGTYENQQGTKVCVVPSTHPQGKFSCDESQKGRIGNQGTEDTFDEGNKNSQGNDTNSSHCPD
jgi:hypothetical protein